MNIVKGVAGLLRKPSGAQVGESHVAPQVEDLSKPPWPEIQFGIEGDEAVLELEWEKYENTLDKEEKENSLQAFLSHFLQVFEDWRPAEWQNQTSDVATLSLPSRGTSCNGDSMKGCATGHPTRVILALTQEMKSLISYVMELQSTPDSTDASPNPLNMERGLRLLDALRILMRSVHNQWVFGYYGGLQTLVALMKAAVVQLKALSGALSMEEAVPYSFSVQMSFLKCLLAHVVSIVSNLVDVNSHHSEKDDTTGKNVEQARLKDDANVFGANALNALESQGLNSRSDFYLKQRATIPLMETGGLNWLVELLRVLRRSQLKNQLMEMPLEQLTLRTLKSALIANPRAQNHFKSIGGLQVLMDGLGISTTMGELVNLSKGYDLSSVKWAFKDFQLQILSLEVLKEAVYGNLNSLQFLFENEGVTKFSDIIRWSAFVLPVLELPESDILETGQLITGSNDDRALFPEGFLTGSSSVRFDFSEGAMDGDKYNINKWGFHVAHLCRILCSFLVPSGNIDSLSSQFFSGQGSTGVSFSYLELATRWILKVLLSIFPGKSVCSHWEEMLRDPRMLCCNLQHYMLYVFRKILASSPASLKFFREGIWDMLFSEYFFYFKIGAERIPSQTISDSEASIKGLPAHFLASKQSATDCSSSKNDNSNMIHIEILQMDVISFVEFAATINVCDNNMAECLALMDALERSACHPEIATMLVKSLHRILQLAADPTAASFKHLNATTRFSNVMCKQMQDFAKIVNSYDPSTNNKLLECIQDATETCNAFSHEIWRRCLDAMFALFAEYLSISEDAIFLALHDPVTVDNLFNLLWEEYSRKFALRHILDLIKLHSLSEKDQEAKLGLCFKYFETFPCIKESDRKFGKNICRDLLAGVRDILQTNPTYYQDLFRDGECFLHIVTLLNGNFVDGLGEQLCLDVLQTLLALLAGNEASKVAFRSLVGLGYKTLEKLLLDCCEGRPSQDLLNALLDLLVDGIFNMPSYMTIQNEDVITLFYNILRQCNEKMQCNGLDTFLCLLEESTANCASCVRAGLLSFLLDWFSTEENSTLISKIGQLIQIIGGHSITGKDIRKVFALLRSTEDGARPSHSSLLLNTVQGMLKDEGPAVFFELNGRDSGIEITTPLHWPCNRGFTFSCWARVESFPGNNEVMGLFSFLTETGKGCTALLDEEKLIIETVTMKRQAVSLSSKLSPKRWYFLCITHSTGRTFSGGHTLKYYVDAALVGSEKVRYPKVTEKLTQCTIGARTPFLSVSEFGDEVIAHKLSLPFCGQLGPVYLFDEVLSSNQVLGIFSLGPTYMYSFLDAESGHVQENILTYGILDAKEGLAPKMVFGFNAQASSSRSLFDISPLLDQSKDRSSYTAVIMAGTRLCYRRILRDILDCVGGVSVFFPLLTQLDQPITRSSVHGQGDMIYHGCGFGDHVAAEVIELIASVLDGNLANQQFMCNISGFSILGFLLQSVSPQHLTNSVVSALGNLLTIIGKYESDASQMLVKNALLRIYLNPHIWIYTQFLVQRELYMFLLNYFERNFLVLRDLVGLPKILDIIRQFYWDTPKSHRAFGNKPLLHPITREIIGERPRPEEISKIRLLLLSLAEMVLRHCVSRSDVKALAAFLDKSEDSKCTEDVLHMVLRLLSHKPFFSAFLEHVHVLGGSQIFLNILKRQTEVIRLQGLQVLGRILVGTPIEKKGMRLFSLGGGSAKFSTENQQRDQSKFEPIFGAIADRLLSFPFTDALCATLFDVLLGGASPKQVLQKAHHPQEQGDKKTSAAAPSSHFVLPQILGVIFKFILNCQDFATRECILTDLQMLLQANQSNIDSLISEYMWQAWFLQVLSDDKIKERQILESSEAYITQDSEKMLVRNTFCIVHCHCICNVKGGWHHIEQTVNFLLLYVEQAQVSGLTLMHELLEDLVKELLDIALKQTIFAVQPCRDNTLYLLTLIDEMLIKDTLSSLPFPGNSLSEELVDDVHAFEGSYLAGPSEHSGKMHALVDDLSGISDGRGIKRSLSMNQLRGWQHSSNQEIATEDHCWHLYDKVWTLISEMNGMGPSKRFIERTTGPSLGQRARGLVESLNIPAAEMAAAVVSGGLAGVVNINTSKVADKAIRLRGEKWPRILFRLVLLYVYKADLGGASRCAQQFVSLLPRLLLNDNEQIKNRLQLFIWSLLDARAQVGSLDDGARFHVISQLIRESVRHGKSMLAMSIADRDNSEDPSSMLNETGSVNSLLQRDRVVAAVREEINYIKSSISERLKQVQELGMEVEELSNLECLQKKQLEDELLSNMGVICSSDGNRRAASRLSYDEDQQSVADKWCHMCRELTDERGPWSATPFPNNKLTRWKLDKTEDPCRRRMKLKRNYVFDEQLCHPPSTLVHDDSETGQNVDNSNPGMGINVLGEVKSFLLKGLRGISEEETFDAPGNEEDEPLNADSAPSEVSPAVDLATEFIDHNDKKVDDEVSDNRQEQTGKFSEAGENEVLLSVSCVVITPKRKMAGHLDVMKASLHFYVEFVVEGTGGSRVFNGQGGLNYPENAESYHLERASKQKTYKIHANGEGEKGNPMERLDPVQQRAFSGKQIKDVKRHRRWDLSKVKAVHSTRYLLQYTAIEIFFSHSISPVFLNFASQDHAKDAGKLIVSLRNEISYPKLSSRGRDEVIHFIDKRLAIEKAERARDDWRRREISNFEYLMILNTLAGRSYNDLTQYPVFPWILADYTSQNLDFNKLTTFRDLSKPVGALDTKRFQVFEERYQNFFDPDIPSFYYGSHYSSLGSVLYYLLRLEPFTTLHRNLQGGKFDHADRLFHSIAATYANCLSNTSDVKELVPEFFYMPEFLTNSNEYHLGVKQDGELIGEVLLPPWAKESPEEFILKNREALESEYVSLNLHNWIDLIFGYKQRGKPAIEAANVFYHLTYEGAVDLKVMEDPLQRAAVEDQIANFGQTPSQLFRKKHPKRGPPLPIARPLYYAPGSITLTSVLPAPFQQSSVIIFIGVIDSTVILVSQELMMSVKMWLTPQLQAGGNFTFSSSQEPFFGIGSDLAISRKICSPLAENLELGSQCFATLQVRSSNFLLSCGHWENSFKVIALNDGRTVQSIRQHKELVTCVSVATDGSIVVTGSHDTTVMVWEVLPSTRIVNKKSRDALLVQDRRKDHIISDKPCHILCGHDDAVTCVGVSVELDLVVSGSKDSSCILHTLREGRYVRSIHHPNGSTLSKIVVSQHGRLVLYSNDDLNLLLYSINGKLLATSESNGRVNCMHLSSCGEFLVCSGDKGQVILRSMHSLEVLKRYDTMGRVIVSLLVTPEDCFLVGTQDGSLLVYSLESQQRKNSLLQSTKSRTFAAG
ncbi:BEACH domain-containing protein B isoform X1 [Cryptomeria japonica]|uniref:BEACH domain-containing protein B isoform X1 n=1 Tax=Cryptomeria japonica TaxID=3369 RepID=UPI0027DA91AA|nr:BEACH domain-containing protein B isoform X1 [Cryptomeria japonica]XP_057837662.2 BEACH domain-containing protein B isoform X1 [Cryptomeria japonica]XP_057837663.2 BEACH domain-containing protein B isoform X1 [Cryptomeria japonica]